MIISTEKLVPSSEARKKFGYLLNEITKNQENYFVILENGKITALLVHPNLIKTINFSNLEKTRQEWNRYEEDVNSAIENLKKTPKNKLPKLLQ